MTVRTSRYLLTSPVRYQDRAGREVRLAYSARRARLVVLDVAVAEQLGAGSVEHVDATELNRLTAAGAIVDTGDDELGSVLGGYRERAADPSVRSISILPTSYCNMACSYCGQEHRKEPPNAQKVERITARVEAALRDPSVRSVVVTWFGGEPMLALRSMQEMSRRFLATADEAGTAYTARMPTNGSLLSRHTMRILAEECRITSMDVTLDGPEAVHDRRRLKRNGIGSFRRTVNVLAEAVRSNSVPDMTIGIRVNVDQENEEHVADLIIDLACVGLASPQVELHLMPVHSWGNDVSAVELAARRYAELELGWLRLAQSLGIRFHPVPTVIRRTTCKATTTHGELIDERGRIYACSEHPLVPGAEQTGVVAQIEDLTGSTARPAGAFDDWYEQVDDGSQQCGRCPLLPVCGGACPKLWREGHVPCPSLKFNWIGRLDLAAAGLGLRPLEAV